MIWPFRLGLHRAHPEGAVEFPAAPDRAALAAYLRQPPPAITYVVYFTPRSGGTWLHDVLRQTDRLGNPGEVFDPGNATIIARNHHAGTLSEYVEVVRRRNARGGVFGFKITYGQLRATFGTPRAFLRSFPKAPSFWLIREDIVAQAVSLLRMEQTAVAHRRLGEAPPCGGDGRRFAYDAERLRFWLQRIRWNEERTERLFSRSRIEPVRLSYERVTAAAPRDVVSLVARHVGVERDLPLDVAPAFVKVASDSNAQFAARFREEAADLVAALAEERRDMLRAVRDP